MPSRLSRDAFIAVTERLHLARLRVIDLPITREDKTAVYLVSLNAVVELIGDELARALKDYELPTQAEVAHD